MSFREEVRTYIEEALAGWLFRSVLQKVGTAGAPQDHRAGGWAGADPIPGVGLEFPGVAFAPQQGEPCFVLGVGPVRLILALASARFRPEVKAGGVTLYTLVKGAAQAVLSLSAEKGTIAINAGTNADVVVNGGTHAVAREGDSAGYLCVTTLMGVISAVAWSKVPITAAPPAVVVCTPIVITGGAPHFKG